MYQYKKLRSICRVSLTITQYFLGAKRKPYLINCITNAIQRPLELQRTIKGAFRRVLLKHLSELERMGVVRYVVYSRPPRKTPYFLTPLGNL